MSRDIKDIYASIKTLKRYFRKQDAFETVTQIDQNWSW